MLLEILFALVFALFFTWLFGFTMRNQGPWNSLWTFFLIVFLGTWSASFWLTNSGPLFWEVSWVPLFVFALILSLFLAALTPITKRTGKHQHKHEPVAPDEPAGAALAFFWLIGVLFFFSILIGIIGRLN